MSRAMYTISAYVPNEYQALLCRIASGLGGDVWLVGGWVLSRLLGRAYAGDVDLVTDRAVHQVRRALMAMGISPVQTARGALRVLLTDNNHIDISSTHLFDGADSIELALSRFDFSAVSVAINVCSGEIVESSNCRELLGARKFVLNDDYARGELNSLSTFRNFEKLIYFYKLVPLTSQRQSEFELAYQRKKATMANMSADEALKQIAKTVHPLIPMETQAWLTRGALRCALMRCLTVWDDFDIIVACKPQTLVAHLDDIGAKYQVNFHGTPKVTLQQGQHVDIIPIDAPSKLTALLERFPHTIDALAYSLRGGELFDPLGVVGDISKHSLRLCKKFWEMTEDADRRYYAMKAIYLMARHALAGDDTDVSLLTATPFVFSNFDRRNACKLCQQLLAFESRLDKSPPRDRTSLGSQTITAAQLISYYS